MFSLPLLFPLPFKGQLVGLSFFLKLSLCDPWDQTWVVTLVAGTLAISQAPFKILNKIILCV